MATYQELSQRVANLRVQATRAEGVLEQAQLQRTQAEDAIRKEGFDPETLDVEIDKLEAQLVKGKENLQKKLNQLAGMLDNYKE